MHRDALAAKQQLGRTPDPSIVHARQHIAHDGLHHQINEERRQLDVAALDPAHISRFQRTRVFHFITKTQKQFVIFTDIVVLEIFVVCRGDLHVGRIGQGGMQTLFGLARFGHQRQLGALQPQPPIVGARHQPTPLIVRQVLVAASGPEIVHRLPFVDGSGPIRFELLMFLSAMRLLLSLLEPTLWVMVFRACSTPIAHRGGLLQKKPFFEYCQRLHGAVSVAIALTQGDAG